MPDQQTPRRPISPWPVGAVALGSFVALAIFLNDTYLALQAGLVTVVVIGFLIHRSRSRSRSVPTVADSTTPTVNPVPLPQAGSQVGLPAILTAEETATLLRIDVAAVVAAIRAGEIPGSQIGGQWRVRSDSLLACLDGAYGTRPGGLVR